MAVVRDKALVRVLMMVWAEEMCLVRMWGVRHWRMLEWKLRLVLHWNMLSVVEENRFTAGAILSLVDKNSPEVSNILHGLIENSNLGHLLDLSSCWHMLSQCFKTLVDSLNSLPLSFISLDSLQVLLRFDLVSMNWMESHKFCFGSHGHCSQC